jgi:hypothetical protein
MWEDVDRRSTLELMACVSRIYGKHCGSYLADALGIIAQSLGIEILPSIAIRLPLRVQRLVNGYVNGLVGPG